LSVLLCISGSGEVNTGNNREPGTSSGNRYKQPFSTSHSSEVFGSNEANNKSGGLRPNPYPHNSNSEESCPSICNSCSQAPKSNNNVNRKTSSQVPVEEIDYAQLPGAVVSNVPVIFYPDCGANAFSRPAIVPYCPAKQPSCTNESPLTMRFPPASAYQVNSDGPSGRNAFAANLSSDQEIGRRRTARRVGVVKRAKQRRRS